MTLALCNVPIWSTFGVRSAADIIAHIFAFRYALHHAAFGIRGTIVVTRALHGCSASVAIWITNCSSGTIATERPTAVGTLSAWSTRPFLAIVNGITAHIRITSEAWFTVTGLLVILRRTQGILATALSDQARNLAHVVLARLILRAVVVYLALDAATPCQGITHKSSLAVTLGLVFPARALSVTATQVASVTCVLAFRASITVHDTRLVYIAIFIGAADEFLHADVVEAVLEVRAT